MRWLAGVLLVVVFAGCTAPGADPVDASPPSSSVSGTSTQDAKDPLVAAPDPVTSALPRMNFTGCRNQGGVFSMPREAAEAALPDGFEPVESTAATQRPGVVLYAIALHCQAFDIDGVAGGPFDAAYAELAVTPSADAALDGVDDCTVPLAFFATDAAVGAALAAYGLGLAGAGTLDAQWAGAGPGQGGTMNSYSLGGASLEFIVGEALPDTLAVGSGDFALYGVQGQQVAAVVKGTAAGGSGHYAWTMFQASGIPALEGVQGAALGFGASGFDLAFDPQPLPRMA